MLSSSYQSFEAVLKKVLKLNSTVFDRSEYQPFNSMKNKILPLYSHNMDGNTARTVHKQ